MRALKWKCLADEMAMSKLNLIYPTYEPNQQCCGLEYRNILRACFVSQFAFFNFAQQQPVWETGTVCRT
jgi:hypothetical protein